MNERRHPTFSGWFLRTFLWIWVCGAVSFVLVFALPAVGLATLGHVAVAAFVMSLAGGLFYMRYRLFHIACPQCATLCRTGQSIDRQHWIARCERCRISWRLGIGTDASGS